jgi:predicted amidophosphoribosyltransferase
MAKQIKYPHVPKKRIKGGHTRAWICEKCGYKMWNINSCPECGNPLVRELTLEELEKVGYDAIHPRSDKPDY